MPCFYHSSHANASTKPENVPFTEAEQGAHVLRMCPLPWQDQYNMNEKGMTPMDMRLLLTSLEAIECVCTHKKGKPIEKSKKPSFKSEKGKKRPGTSPMVWVSKKVRFEKHCKKGRKISYPVDQNFAQLTEKIKKLEKALKKSGKKAKKHRCEDSNSNSE